MKKDGPDNSELRARAEKHLYLDPGMNEEDFSQMSSDKIAILVHDLRVHEIELKMQNYELRRIQNELEKERDRYSHLYDFAPIGYLTLTEKGIIDRVNFTMASMLGLDRGTLIGKFFSGFIIKEDQGIFYKYWYQLMAADEFQQQSCALRFAKKDEALLYLRLECTLIKGGENGDSRQIRMAASDVSEIKQINEALRESEEKYRSMMVSMKDAACICSPEFRIEYLNPAMVDRIGGNAIGEVCHKAIYGRDEKCPWCLFAQVEQVTLCFF